MAQNLKSTSITVDIKDWDEFGRICEKNALDRSKKIRLWVKKFNESVKIGKININV